MAFAVTGFKVQNRALSASTREEATGKMTLAITSTTSDVSLDLSNAGGTFWTQAQADAVYGQLATNALAALQAIQAVALDLYVISSEFLENKTKAINAGTALTYHLTTSNHAPIITLHTGEGGNQLLTLEWILSNNVQLHAADYGA